MKYDTILFDADGTLFDFSKSERESIAAAMEEFGITATAERIAEYSRINDMLWKMLERGEIEKQVLLYRRFEIFIEKYGFNCDSKRLAESYMKNLSVRGYLYPGAATLCRKLAKDFRLYIVTNGVAFIQKGRFAGCGIKECFEEMFISGEIGYEKPSIKYFEYIAEKIENFNKNKTIIIGDSLSADIAGGIGFGIDTCLYNPNNKTVQESMNITFTAKNYDEIYKYLTME